MSAVGGDGQRDGVAFEVGVDPVHWGGLSELRRGVAVGGDGRIIGTRRNSADPVRRPDYRNMGLSRNNRTNGLFLALTNRGRVFFINNNPHSPPKNDLT